MTPKDTTRPPEALLSDAQRELLKQRIGLSQYGPQGQPQQPQQQQAQQQPQPQPQQPFPLMPGQQPLNWWDQQNLPLSPFLNGGFGPSIGGGGGEGFAGFGGAGTW
jgi:hypothetical protein